MHLAIVRTWLACRATIAWRGNTVHATSCREALVALLSLETQPLFGVCAVQHCAQQCFGPAVQSSCCAAQPCTNAKTILIFIIKGTGSITRFVEMDQRHFAVVEGRTLLSAKTTTPDHPAALAPPTTAPFLTSETPVKPAPRRRRRMFPLPTPMNLHFLYIFFLLHCF